MGVRSRIRWRTVRSFSARPNVRLPRGMTLRGTLDVVRAVRTRGRDADRAVHLCEPGVRMDAAAFARDGQGRGGRRRADPRLSGRGGRSRCARPLVDAGLDPIFLISPTTSDARIRRSAELGRGFLYVISRLGVTGVRDNAGRRHQRLVAPRPGAVDAARGAWIRHLVARSTSRRRARRQMRPSSAARS